jgi:hypothetical protein
MNVHDRWDAQLGGNFFQRHLCDSENVKQFQKIWKRKGH